MNTKTLIKKACLNSGLSLNKLGPAIGVDRRYIYFWKAGTRKPKPEQVKKLKQLANLD